MSHFIAPKGLFYALSLPGGSVPNRRFKLDRSAQTDTSNAAPRGRPWQAFRIILGALLCSGTTISSATSVTLSYLEGKNPVSADSIATYGPDLMGDKVNLFNGALGFEHTDISLPGNNNLPVALTRKYSAGRPLHVQGQFADWDLDVPRIGGSFAGLWRTNTGGLNRCTEFSAPPQITGYSRQSLGVQEPLDPLPNAGEQKEGAPQRGVVGFIASDYWQGTFLHVPGQGSQEVLRRAAGYNVSPGNAQDYPLVTHQNWQISCLPTVQNAEGEGFVATSPDGVRYQFDWMAARYLGEVKKQGASISREEAFLMATRVTDRFGNWVSYTYDTQLPYSVALSRVESSDGRFIQFTNQGGVATSATDGTRTFSYGYAAGVLRHVLQPDGSRWTFNLLPMTPENLVNLGENATCEWPGDSSVILGVGTITHPSGAVGRFTTDYVTLERSHVDRYCKYVDFSQTLTFGAVWPKAFLTQVITAKELSGPGMETQKWTYGYGGRGSWSTCTNCPDRRQVMVTHPGNSVTMHTFGIRWRVNEGQLLQVDEDWSPDLTLKTTTTRYRSPEGQSYPEQFGTSTQFRHSDWLSSRNRPVDQRVVSVQGSSFMWRAEETSAGFDYFARPVLASKFSSLGFSRTDATLYKDLASPWVRGQTERVTEQSTGRDVERHEFYANGQKYRSFAFDKLTQRFEYNADGTLAAVYDDAGKGTWLFNYKRGKPQAVQFADYSSESQQLNNLGNADWITNAAGTTTRFEYDAMGRVSRVIYPTEDQSAYHDTVQRFEQVPYWEYGLADGHWRQIITTGNAVTERYFDAMWREVFEVRYDASDRANTSVYELTRYDSEGRKSFQSYPLRYIDGVTAAGVAGKSWEYDRLGREVKATQSSELGGLETKTDYLTGFQRRVTNPRGYATTFGYQAFDAPSQDAITTIAAPEGVNVSINRDVFGKANSITRSGSGNGGFKSATRSYVYDQHQRLCKTVEPETGATVQQYDQAGNVQWRASGLSLTSNVCDPYNVPDSRKISFGYDPRDRLTSTTYGDGSPGITRQYYADGKLKYTRSEDWIWNYSYNNRRLLTNEEYSIGSGSGSGYPIQRRYNAYGHQDALTYWGGIATVDYAPNALGQPTQAGSYANQVRWHPNGAIASYTLGNGITHTTTQNLRGMPARLNDSGVVNDQYWYDANGNPVYMEDQQQWVNSRGMSYDGLDRLNIANGPWGGGGYQYDTLDNIVASTVGGRALSHGIDANTNRLSSLSGTQYVNFGYDANGNITQRGAQSFSFDIGNRMTAAPGKAAKYIYDAEGRRSWTTYDDGSYSGAAYTQDGKLMITGHSQLGTNWYIYLGGKQIAQHIHKPGIGMEVKYIHTDALGSPVARTDASGQQSNRTQYEPYGGTHAGGVPAGLEPGFTGHVNDAETGLVYMQQRYYEPLAGRFLSVDPITTNVKDGSSFNRYVYGNNNPYKFKDPDGRLAETFWDVASLALSVNEFKNNPSIGNAIGVAIDAAAVAIPGVPGGVGAIRAMGHAADAGRAAKTEIHHVVAQTDKRAAEARDVMKSNGINPKTEATNKVALPGDKHDVTKRDSYLRDTNQRVAAQPNAEAVKAECCKIADNLQKSTVDELKKQYPGK